MKVKLWRGYHSAELLPLIRRTWEQEDLLIVCPPFLQDLSFVKHLPLDVSEFIGDWSQHDKNFLTSEVRSQSPNYREKPVLGVFTSGTISGQPRLILYSKENIESSLDGILSFFDPSRMGSIFCYPQPFHTFGLLLGYMLSIKKNIPLVVPEGRYNRKAHELRLSLGDPGLLTLGTPTHFYDLIQYLKTTEGHIRSSYSCIIGGAPVRVSLWKQVQQVLKIEQPSIGYGCTEASPGVTHHPPGRQPIQDSEIGFPLPSLESLPDSGKGVIIKGPSLCMAVIEKDQISFPREILIRDSLSVREDGMWLYQGRLDLMLNRGGQKVSLELVEQTIFLETGLHVICVAVPDVRLGQTLAMLVKRLERDEESPFLTQKEVESIRQILKNNFSIQIDSQFLLEVNEFPISDSHKIDRKAVQNIFQNLRKESHEQTS